MPAVSHRGKVSIFLMKQFSKLVVQYDGETTEVQRHEECISSKEGVIAIIGYIL